MQNRNEIRMGPNNYNDQGIQYLEGKGREYGSCVMVDATRMRALAAVPSDQIIQLQLDISNGTGSTCYYNDVTLQGNYQTKRVEFCVIQRSDRDVPVFVLPSTDEVTVNMNNEQRAEHMNRLFNQCYQVYIKNCTLNGKIPVSQENCAATVVAGTKTIFGGKHFTAMVKPPGENWEHVDPTDFGGPQKVNRKQCGGYASMIEAEALIHYSQKTINEAQEDKRSNRVVKLFKQFINNLSFKFNTWFAGRRALDLNPEGTPIKHSLFVTTYAEMGDASAKRIATSFGNQQFLRNRGVKDTRAHPTEVDLLAPHVSDKRVPNPNLLFSNRSEEHSSKNATKDLDSSPSPSIKK